MSFRAELRSRAAGRGARIVLTEGDDPRVQEAAEILAHLDIAVPRLLDGDRRHPSKQPEFAAVAEHLRARRPGAVRDGVHALDLASDPLRYGASLVAIGAADGCVAGAVATTAEVVRAALWAIGLRPGLNTVSAAMYHALPDGRVLTYTDIAVLPMPTAEQLADAAVAAARDRRALVGDAPIVAFLSYSTKGSATGPDPSRMQDALARFRELAPDVLADGELQLDAALVPEVAARKCPASPVAGRANVLVFPSLDAANIAYKLTERLAHASAAGPLLQGLARPMSDLSRGASTDDIVDVAAMVALQSGVGSD
ncbi:MAG: phosphate acyltransferase [Gemmatimonadota bacterium]